MKNTRSDKARRDPPILIPTTAFFYFLGTLVYSVSILAFIVNGSDGTDALGIIFTLLACLPLPVAYVVLVYYYVYPIATRKRKDVAKFKFWPSSFLMVYGSLILAWAMFYMIFWVHLEFAWKDMDEIIATYEVWVALVASSIYLAVGTASAFALPGLAVTHVMTSIQIATTWLCVVFVIEYMISRYNTQKHRNRAILPASISE